MQHYESNTPEQNLPNELYQDFQIEDNNNYCCFHIQSQTNHRKIFSKLLMSQHHQSNQSNEVYSASSIMIQLYISQSQDQEPAELLRKCRLNPNLDPNNIQRDDLEYYIPQLVNYLVFHDEMKNQNLLDFIVQASQVDFFFAHLVYFYFYSVSQIILTKQALKLQSVMLFLDEFLDIMAKTYENTLLIAEKMLQDDELGSSQFVHKGYLHSNKSSVNPVELVTYGTNYYEQTQYYATAEDIILNNYFSIHKFPVENMYEMSNRKSFSEEPSFMSNIDFWQDLIKISERLHLADPKIISLKADVAQINSRLPAAVYLPFQHFRNNVILNIVPTECKVFSTKERSPFYICMELFRPEDENDIIKQSHFPFNDKVLSDPKTLKKLQASKNHRSCTQSNPTQYFQHQTISILNPTKPIKTVKELDSLFEFQEEIDKDSISVGYEKNDKTQDELILSRTQSDAASEEFLKKRHLKQSIVLDIDQMNLQNKKISSQERQELTYALFGESSQEQEERIKRKSPFGKFKTWKLVHLIIKSDDNLKQEQFALQLISQISQIFQQKNLPLKLTVYEVLSLGPTQGIISMVKDATTIDALKRNLNGISLSEFFHQFYDNKIRDALLNFLYSLVAYSLVQYFLQIKDRHNGNILLHKDGYIVHIDFGFFLSNTPGKGIEFERKVPFKLLTEYIEVLGGVESQLFEKRFRRLFYEGFKSIREEKDKLLVLVKMMYSGHGRTLPCFQKGQKTIENLENRFFPDCKNDRDLYVKCQELIDASIDNWRARWYDKYQYYFQGIFY